MISCLLAVVAVVLITTPVVAQDVRGLEICTAEKAIDRRTSCLQSNAEFLQRALAAQTRETRDRLTATDRELASQKAEIAALKSELTKLQQQLADLKKPAADKK